MLMKARIILLVTVLALAAQATSAQIKIGVKGGVLINTLRLNSNIGHDLTSSDNRAGFTAGVIIDARLPVVGLGIEGNALYARRSTRIDEYSKSLSRDYLTFPINLKYRIALPVVGKWVAPFVTTGPEFSFQINKKDESKWPGIDTNTMTCTWNVGFGLEIMSHLQIHASYGLGLTRSIKFDKNIFSDEARGKDNYWSVTAAYIF